MDVKTLEHMKQRVKKCTEIEETIAALSRMEDDIAKGKEIRVDLYGSPYQALLGYDNVKFLVSNLIELRIAELQKEFDEI